MEERVPERGRSVCEYGAQRTANAEYSTHNGKHHTSVDHRADPGCSLLAPSRPCGLGLAAQPLRATV